MNIVCVYDIFILYYCAFNCPETGLALVSGGCGDSELHTQREIESHSLQIGMQTAHLPLRDKLYQRYH